MATGGGAVSYERGNPARCRVLELLRTSPQRHSRSAFFIALNCTTSRWILAGASVNQGPEKGGLIVEQDLLENKLDPAQFPFATPQAYLPRTLNFFCFITLEPTDEWYQSL